MPEVIGIVGPTAAGKTAFAVRLAEVLGAEIVSADAFQVYRGMGVGTGSPDREELDRVRHHLVGCLEPWQAYSAGRFAELAREQIVRARERGRGVLVVGGSGLYHRALFGGLDTGPSLDPSRRLALRQRLDREGPEALHSEISLRDPKAAARIGHRDGHRIVRALELLEDEGTLPGGHPFRRATRGEMSALHIGLTVPRELLYRRIAERVQEMLAAGWEDEVRRLVRMAGERRDGGWEGWQSSAAIGYRSLHQVLCGELEREDAVQLIVRQTRRYAKRQLTWFRGVPGVRWLDAERALRLPESALLRIVQTVGTMGAPPTGPGHLSG